MNAASTVVLFALALIGPGCASPGVFGTDAGRGADASRAPSDAPPSPRADAGPPATDGGRPEPTGVPASIEIYSGEGLMMPQGWPAGDELKVIVLDAVGEPVAGTRVTWTVASGGVGIGGEFAIGAGGVSTTNELGIARATVRGEFGSSMSSVLPSTVRAEIDAGSVLFHVFCSYTPPGLTPASPAAYVTTPEGRDFGTVAPGAVVPGALRVAVANMYGAETGRGPAGIGVRFRPVEASGDDAPVVRCANATVGVRGGGTVLTDATGIASCDLEAPTTPGTYSIGVFVGGATIFQPYFLTVR